MTLIANPARRRPVSHAFTVPVVRALTPRPLTVGSDW